MAEMSTRNIIGTLTKHIRASKREGDYYDENNILRCGKCGEPREFLYDNWTPKTFDNGLPNTLCGKEPRYVVRPMPCRCDREAEEREKARIEKAELERTIRTNRARCFDIKGYEDVTFSDDKFMSDDSKAVIRSYLQNFDKVKANGQGMIFYGPVGTGKTFTAAMIANYLLDKGKRVKFTSLADLNQQMTEDYGNKRGIILTYLRECDLVVLDDLGTERKTQTANENVFQVINKLTSDGGISVILTTNLDYQKDLVGDTEIANARSYSRIIQKCKPVRFEGRDIRKKMDGKSWAF